MYEVRDTTIPEGHELWCRCVVRRRDEWQVEAAPVDALGRRGPKYGVQVVETLGYEFRTFPVSRDPEEVGKRFTRGWGRVQFDPKEQRAFDAGNPEPEARPINGTWLRRSY